MRKNIHQILLSSLVVGAFALSTAAFAHHGWSWTDNGDFKLTGTITKIYLGNPHASLDVDADGEMWRVELAPPSRTRAAGFVEGVAKVGDEVTALGQRSRDESEKRMKAERISVNGKNYDVYPNRLKGS